MPALDPDPATVGPVQRRKLHQDVMDRLAASIRAESYGPGDMPPSAREIMARYGAGRPAVREALQNLEWMGQTTINHGERARILDAMVAAAAERTTAGRLTRANDLYRRAEAAPPS